MPRFALSLSLSLLSCALAAETWAPIPKEVWDLQENPAKAIRDAVVLEKRIRLTNIRTEHTFRVRVLNEAGRNAAQFEMSSDAYDFEGRTVYRDGKQVTFNSRKDFTTQRITSASGFDRSRSVLIPPGVTADCVVELSWKVSGTPNVGPLPPTIYMMRAFLGSPYKTLRSIVEVPVNYTWPMELFGAMSEPPVKTMNGIFQVYTFQNPPLRQELAYGLPSTEPHPQLVVYFQPERMAGFIGKPPLEYWSIAADWLWKDTFHRDVKKGSSFKKLYAELSQGLPADASPVAKAFHFLPRLQAAWLNTDRLTYAEAANRPKKFDKIDSGNLERAADRKETDSQGMRIAFFHLLRAAGVQPHLGLVADRQERIFEVKFRNIWQFSGATELIGVETPEKTIQWFQPDLRFAAPGLLDPDLQNTPGLDVETGKWTCADLRVPVQAAAVNQRSFDCTVTVGEEEDRFQVAAAFKGWPEYSERWQFAAQEVKEQNRILKDRFEKALKGAAIEKAEVLHAQDPTQNVAWVVEGTQTSRGGRRRQVDPFPGIGPALWIPGSFPPERTENILIPYLRVQTMTSRIQVPKGFKVGTWAPVKHANLFGTVDWTATPKPKGDLTEITVVCRVEVSRISSRASGYAALKEFLGWVQEATNQTLLLEKAQ